MNCSNNLNGRRNVVIHERPQWSLFFLLSFCHRALQNQPVFRCFVYLNRFGFVSERYIRRAPNIMLK